VSNEWIAYCRVLYRNLPDQHPADIKAIINKDDELLAPFGPALRASGVNEVIELEHGGHEATRG
jgi:hypothetical protein